MSSVEGHLVVTVPTEDVASELAGDAADMAEILDHVGTETEHEQATYARTVVELVTSSGWEFLEALAAAMAAKKREEGA